MSRAAHGRTGCSCPEPKYRDSHGWSKPTTLHGSSHKLALIVVQSLAKSALHFELSFRISALLYCTDFVIKKGGDAAEFEKA